jgi:hypothetical protein
MGGPQRRCEPQGGTAGPCGSHWGGGVTGGGRWLAVGGELLRDGEAVGLGSLRDGAWWQALTRGRAPLGGGMRRC